MSFLMSESLVAYLVTVTQTKLAYLNRTSMHPHVNCSSGVVVLGGDLIFVVRHPSSC